MSDVNIRSASYLIARSRADCRHCRLITAVTALGVPPGHEVLVPDERTAEWERAAFGAMLFHIDSLPEAVRRRLVARAGIVEPAAGWSNRCEHCGGLLDDEDLFGEPGAAFFPESAAGVGAVRVILVEEPFAALAAGYVADPHFLQGIGRD